MSVSEFQNTRSCCCVVIAAFFFLENEQIYESYSIDATTIDCFIFLIYLAGLSVFEILSLIVCFFFARFVFFDRI